MNKNMLFTYYLTGTLLLTMVHATAGKAADTADFSGLTLVQIYNNEDLKKIAVDKGGASFKQHCAECHGVDGAGKTGVPDLTNGLWLWGGSLSDHEITIRYGIRSGHALQRFSEMPAYKDYDPLTAAQIDDLVEYVLNISMQEADQTAVLRAANDFENICSECHNYNGAGRMEYYGAPDLTDYYWLFGETREAIHKSIADGQSGVSPAFEGKLDNETIKMLAIYVHYLTHQ